MQAIQPPQPLHPPSDWLLRWAHLIRPGGRVLDVACGPGRHMYWLHAQGFQLCGVDRDPAALASLAPLAQAGAQVLAADIENGLWPLAGQQFDAVLVTNYLWRARIAEIADCVAPGGLLIYETFAQGQESVGRPARAEFLLAPGELLQSAASARLRVIAYEDGFVDTPAPRFVQRMVAARAPAAAPQKPVRHLLRPP
ncbi:class I SAM-dependent methyltransferase [Xenophilus arseniciresistens]|uniref:Class I SAM-dependent methyltransferase n=1 Tax=Xenophilus arseniciresistens TaxID=1283306 RepID=A0AAE3N887_9BURK|nr:class I SAM-dependent methyltransferase [Xenophilus arseniciresistens]MDA7415707.1 class I SAM-dependent methyltransferase [Xenophilus arseniciresistens]